MGHRAIKTTTPPTLAKGKLDQFDGLNEAPEKTRQLIGDLARGLGAYARQPMSEHDYRLELEALLRRQAERR